MFKLVTRSLTTLLFVALFVTVNSFIANGQAKPNGGAKEKEQAADSGNGDLTGTWMVTITPDDGSPSFVGYYSFFADGNASFSSAGPPIPALGNPGYGVWKKTGANKFAATIRMNSYNALFQFDGTLKINAKIRMTGRDSFVTQDKVKVYDPDGNEIVTLGGSAQGRRITVEDQ